MARNNGKQNDRHLAKVTAAEVDKVLADIVGIEEIATRLGVGRTTVEKWRQRAKAYSVAEGGEGWAFPPPRHTLAGRGLWSWTLDVAPWLTFTERWPDQLVWVGSD